MASLATNEIYACGHAYVRRIPQEVEPLAPVEPADIVLVGSKGHWTRFMLHVACPLPGCNGWDWRLGEVTRIERTLDELRRDGAALLDRLEVIDDDTIREFFALNHDNPDLCVYILELMVVHEEPLRAMEVLLDHFWAFLDTRTITARLRTRLSHGHITDNDFYTMADSTWPCLTAVMRRIRAFRVFVEAIEAAMPAAPAPLPGGDGGPPPPTNEGPHSGFEVIEATEDIEAGEVTGAVTPSESSSESWIVMTASPTSSPSSEDELSSNSSSSSQWTSPNGIPTRLQMAATGPAFWYHGERTPAGCRALDMSTPNAAALQNFLVDYMDSRRVGGALCNQLHH